MTFLTSMTSTLSNRTLDYNSAFIALDPIGAYNYTPHQQADITGRMSALLTGLIFQDASSLLASDKAYLGMNATINSMSALSLSVMHLRDVSGENLASDSDSPTTGAQGNGMLLSADYPGVSASIQGAYNDYYANPARRAIESDRRSNHYRRNPIHTSGTLSTRTFRQVDVLRLVSDGVLDLWSNTPRIARMQEQTSDGLQKWAKRYFVAYAEEESAES
ncbi:hypothetical protein DL770_004053 [Monosporascus sp. CRB-9-2]|nr:hypothetical protein DL770_004053 [Monosporascus sp. CRB-9-2]